MTFIKAFIKLFIKTVIVHVISLKGSSCKMSMYMSLGKLYFAQKFYLRIMLALCLMLLPSYYAQNYAGIIGSSLHIRIYRLLILALDS